MRVIAGQAKGHHLKSPRRSSTRPTTELVRGAVFAMLESLADEWAVFLDLYAGTGSVGIEALSRGAKWVDFVEQNASCCAIIQDNLERTGFQDQAQVHCCSALSAISRMNKRYDTVILDPPYADLSVADTLAKLVTSPLVDLGSTVVIHHSSRQPLPQESHDFQLIRHRHYGDSHISIYRKGENQ
jgi:16S rRNA (guanine966-N2)-methyltransferase